MKTTSPDAPQEPRSGSPPHGEPVFLAIGRLLRPHGVRGEILMQVLTDFPERLQPGVRVFLGEERRPIRILQLRPHGKRMILSLEGFTDRERVGELRNQVVTVRADDRPALPEGEYYHHELLGIRVVSEQGEDYGELVEIITTGANDVYVVRSPDRADLLFPAIESVILAVNLERGEMEVRPLPGLIPGE